MSTALPDQVFRLAEGGLIDRTRPLRFSFDGRSYDGFEGDSLASALLANGVCMVARSFKFHRPRGIFSAGDEEPCALVEVGRDARREPNCRATLVPLTDGLTARSQHCWPSLDFDAGRILDLTHPLWPAGFYNKTFMWPSWRTWEWLVRKSAGLGRAPKGPDPDRYEQLNVHCDVLICGAGPAGLVTALVAGHAGLRVILADQDETPGGSLNWERCELDGMTGPEWADSIASELADLSGVILLPRTTFAGIYDHNVSTLLQRGGQGWRECLWTVRPRHVVLAGGAIEQGLILPNNDRPGIMQAGAVRHYLNRYAVAAGRRVVIATNNDTAYQTAFDLTERGITVAAITDGRRNPCEELVRRAADLGATVFPRARIADTHGGKRLEGVTIESLDGVQLTRQECDLLAVSGGWAPRLQLLGQARGRLRFDERSRSFVPESLPAGLTVVGSANGTTGLEACIAEARAAAVEVCKQLGAPGRPGAMPQITAQPLASIEVEAMPLSKWKPRQWIDLAQDVTLADAELAVREGFVSVEHFKRYTTAGMAFDQGKTGNLEAFTTLAALAGREPGEVGTTTFRPPYAPLTLGAIAGRNLGDFYHPLRLLPAHRLHQGLDAHFSDYAGWWRPECYPLEGETLGDAVQREAAAARAAVGLFDNSPIGKIELRGPDAAAFLDRFYINDVLSLEPGRARYGLMLNENGVIIDDGIFVCLSPDHYLVHTTSGHAAAIADWLEEWLQCEWPGLRVLVDDVTAQWANFTLSGPRAREMLASLETGIDLSREALPHMAAASGHVLGIKARTLRASFSGEASFEVSLPAAAGAAFMQAVLEAGKSFELTPYGVETLMLLRLEKGYLHVGIDTDGATTPDDVGWGAVALRKERDYIGRRSLFRSANTALGRKQLVGLQSLDAHRAITPGAHVLVGADRSGPATTDGWVTSAAFSPNLQRAVAMAVIRDGRELEGRTVTVIDQGNRLHARVVPPRFLDPDNERLQS